MSLKDTLTTYGALQVIANRLDRITIALERIADALAPADVPPTPAPDDPLQVVTAPTFDYALLDQIARRLQTQLGRAPTEDEILHEAEGLEWTAEDAAEYQQHRRRRTRTTN